MVNHVSSMFYAFADNGLDVTVCSEVNILIPKLPQWSDDGKNDVSRIKVVYDWRLCIIKPISGVRKYAAFSPSLLNAHFFEGLFVNTNP